MVTRATIHPATLRDATWVMWNLREADEIEVACQVKSFDRTALAGALLMSGETFAARVGDQPIAIFGTYPMNAACLSVWALGTPLVWRAAVPIGDFMIDEHLPARIEEGYLTMEARSHVEHKAAHSWLRTLGGEQIGEPFVFGVDRETFLLFRWSADRLADIASQRRRVA